MSSLDQRLVVYFGLQEGGKEEEKAEENSEEATETIQSSFIRCLDHGSFIHWEIQRPITLGTL